jgi:hypothetical protein
MTTATRAGALYALTVFLIGFILGTVRLLLIAARLGEIAAAPVRAVLVLDDALCAALAQWLRVGLAFLSTAIPRWQLTLNLLYRRVSTFSFPDRSRMDNLWKAHT